MEIREIKPDDDRYAISRIYEKSWKFAYKGIIPQDYLDNISADRWVSSIDKGGKRSMVMLENDIFIGTSGFCKSRFPEYEGMGEIVSIYLLPQYIGKGYGTQLLSRTVLELNRMGYSEIFLWVLEENYKARAFYEKFGFSASGKYLNDNIGGKSLREMQYCYLMSNNDKLY